TMIEQAEAVNGRLLKVFPKGFTLGPTHHAHISILQRYVRTRDLDKVYAVVDKILANENPTGWKLKAFKYYYIPWKDIGLAGIVVEPTDDLLALQQKLIDAVAPFETKTGSAEAFDAFTFSPAGASVYQLGNFGTARKKLKEWTFKP